MPNRWTRAPARPAALFGFGLGGLVDGVLLHQILQWHHLISDDTTAGTLAGLERNTRADGLFHAATILVVVAAVILLWRAAATSEPARDRSVIGATLLGFGAFHIVDEVVFHALLDLHHIRMVENYLAYDLGFAAIGVALIAIGGGLMRSSPNPVGGRVGVPRARRG